MDSPLITLDVLLSSLPQERPLQTLITRLLLSIYEKDKSMFSDSRFLFACRFYVLHRFILSGKYNHKIHYLTTYVEVTENDASFE